MTRRPEQLIIPAGTELNYGLCEDSDSVVTKISTRLKVVGELRNGALPVRLIEDGRESIDTFYYHQPEPQHS